MISEDFLQTVWKNHWFTDKTYLSEDGRVVKIVSPGYLNDNDGPDFTNAKIEIDGLLWVGNVEIHTHSSDWNNHSHHSDSKYNNVILHVVKYNNKAVFNSKGINVCTIEIEYEKQFEQNFLQLINSVSNIACSSSVQSIDPFFIKHWLTSLAAQRLEFRYKRIQEFLSLNTNDWETAFYVFLARSFGFGVNNDAFEMLARSIPINIISKHSGNIFQLEALFFGQAGLLVKPFVDEYHEKLGIEYEFLRVKYSLTPIPATVWRFMRIRPSNFPTIRIAELVALLNRVSRLFEQCLQFSTIDSLKAFLSASVSDYWQKHYVFAKEHDRHNKHLGEDSISLLLINVIIPFVFAYGKYKEIDALCERALQYFEKLPPESNRIIINWLNLNIKASNAMESQALIHLNENYCKKRKCIQCQIGQRICTQ